MHTKLENIAKLFFVFLPIPGFCYNSASGDYPDDLASKPLPRIISRGETIRAAFGERVQLPCHVEQLGKQTYLHFTLHVIKHRLNEALRLFNNFRTFEFCRLFVFLS